MGALGGEGAVGEIGGRELWEALSQLPVNIIFTVTKPPTPSQKTTSENSFYILTSLSGKSLSSSFSPSRGTQLLHHIRWSRLKPHPKRCCQLSKPHDLRYHERTGGRNRERFAGTTSTQPAGLDRHTRRSTLERTEREPQTTKTPSYFPKIAEHHCRRSSLFCLTPPPPFLSLSLYLSLSLSFSLHSRPVSQCILSIFA